MGLGMGIGERGVTGCDKIYERIYLLKKNKKINKWEFKIDKMNLSCLK